MVLHYAAIAKGLAAGMAMASTRKRKYGSLRSTRRLASSRARFASTRYRRRGRMTKRRWQAKARMTVGIPRNYSTAKTSTGYNVTNVVKTLQQIHPNSCVRIGKGTGINQRLRDSCIVSGVRIQYAIRNSAPYNVFINWAVIHPKDEAAVAQGDADFFRDYNSDRSWDSSDATKNGQEWSHAAINTDKYDVLRRGKFLLGTPLGPSARDEVSENKASMKEMDIYVKLGRTFTFDNDGGNEPFENVYFVWWASNPLLAAGTATTGPLNESTKVITYFREPKSG